MDGREIVKELLQDGSESGNRESSYQEQRQTSLITDVISDFQSRKIDVHNDIEEKSGEGTASIFRESLTELGKRMELTSDEKNALNRIKKLFNDVDRMGAGGIRNTVNKIADRLGLDTQTSF